MRILYLHQYFSTPQSAYGGRSYEFAVRLTKKGHTVDIVTSHNLLTKAFVSVKKRSRITHEGINIHIIRSDYCNEMGFLQRIKAFLHFAIASSIYILRLPRTDVVFATSTPLTIGIPGIVAAKLWRKPLVFEVRDLWPEMAIRLGILKNPVLQRLSKWLEHQIYNHSTRIIALSEGMANGVAISGYPRDRIITIPNASDTNLFVKNDVAVVALRKRHSLEGSFVCLYAGSLAYFHGVPILVEVARILKDRNPRVMIVIIGEGKEKQVIADGIQRHELTNILLLDAVPKVEIVDWVATADLGFVLALHISFGNHWLTDANNKFFDYCAGGLPSLFNTPGSAADLVERECAGFAARDGSAETMAEIICRAEQDPTLLAEMRGNAARLGREVFDRDKLFVQFEQVLTDAVADWKSRPRRGYLHLKAKTKL